MKTQNTFLSAFTRELRMQKRLRHITIGATIAGLIMVSAFLVTLYYVNRVFNDSYNAHVTDFIDKFSIAVTRQVEGDMNALSTLSLFMNDVNSVSDEVIRNADEFIRIPMCGFVESLNVSASAAILLYLLSNRVRNAPVDWRILETERNEILLRWMKSTVKDSERIMKRGGF